MNVSVYQAASAMDGHMKWHETIAGNLSGSSAPGFKGTGFRFAAALAGQLPNGAASSPDAPQHFMLPIAESTLRFDPGPMQKSESPTHVAIAGDGFFQIELPDGEIVYTRDGEFTINAEGLLVTKFGDPVLGSAGPVNFDDNATDIEISAAGEISADGRGLGQQLQLANLPDPSSLLPMAGGYYALDPTAPEPDLVEDPVFQPGFLEQSNVSPLQELTQMMQAMRAYESNQKVIQAHDQRLGRTISELGQPL